VQLVLVVALHASLLSLCVCVVVVIAVLPLSFSLSKSFFSFLKTTHSPLSFFVVLDLLFRYNKKQTNRKNTHSTSRKHNKRQQKGTLCTPPRKEVNRAKRGVNGHGDRGSVVPTLAHSLRSFFSVLFFNFIFCSSSVPPSALPSLVQVLDCIQTPPSISVSFF
jgi:hypothetical protein